MLNRYIMKYRRSLLKRMLKKTGCPEYGDISHYFDGIWPENTCPDCSGPYKIYSHGKFIKETEKLSYNNMDIDEKEIFIVGAGPSIKKQKLEILKERQTALLNGSITLIKEYGLKPAFIAIIDSNFCIKRGEMLKLIPNGSRLVLSYSAMKEIALYYPETIKNNRIFLIMQMHDWKHAYLSDKGYEIFDNFDYGFLDSGSVMNLAIQTAAMKRIKNIYLAGLDIGNANEPRFYENKTDKMKSGLLKDYETKILPFMKLASKWTKDHGIKMFNCSPVSKLPYSIIPFSDILQK